MVNRHAEDIIAKAREYVGLLSRAAKNNEFGTRTGANGKPWDGSFIEVVLRQLSMSAGTTLTSTTAALAYFHRTNRVFTKPQKGDLVFFAWSTDDDGFGQPHVGLVTETRDWKTLNRFIAIEGQVASGQPKGRVESDGVYERARFGSDVLAFVRPRYAEIKKPAEPTAPVPNLRPSQFQTNRLAKGVELLQAALHDYLGVYGFDRGRFDSQTRSAVLRFQREIGYIGGDGTPDEYTLEALARLTNYRHFKPRKAD